MNLLIGVLGSNYDRYEVLGEATFTRARALMLLSWRAWPCLRRHFDAAAPEELWVCARRAISDEELRSSRSVAAQHAQELGEQVAAVRTEHGNELAALRASVDRIEASLVALAEGQAALHASVAALAVRQAGPRQMASPEPGTATQPQNSGALESPRRSVELHIDDNLRL